MMPLVQVLAAEGFSVRLTCGLLGFSAQSFYKWRAEPFSKRDYDDAHLLNAVVDVHADDPEFGYRFIADELERAGHVVSERRVWRLCSEHKVWSTTAKKGRRHSGKRPGTPGPRRPRPARLQRARTRHGLVDRHHRASHRKGQALRLLHQRRLLEPDRRVRDG
jgi:helix-turn-helix protein